jgi:hypothetical protein
VWDGKGAHPHPRVVALNRVDVALDLVEMPLGLLEARERLHRPHVRRGRRQEKDVADKVRRRRARLRGRGFFRPLGGLRGGRGDARLLRHVEQRAARKVRQLHAVDLYGTASALQRAIW